MLLFGFISPNYSCAEKKKNSLLTMNEKTLPKAKGKKWVVVEELTDEFDTWDAKKWTKSLWNYGEPVQMRAENSGVEDGNLWIRASYDPTNKKRWFRTSRVMSKAQIKFPMYTECRIKAAYISAYTTYWLNNGNSGARDEIDICENNPRAAILEDREMRAYTMMSQYFIVKNGITERDHGNFDNRKLSEKNPMRAVAWNEDYHILGALWLDKHTVQFYLNGVPAGKVVSKKEFTREQNIIWDLWTSKDNWVGGLPEVEHLENKKNSTMLVDWIHTYKLVDK